MAGFGTNSLGGTELSADKLAGEADFPAAGDVRSGTSFNEGATTGTLTLPATGDVQSGVQYGAGGTELTGNFTVPTEAQVQSGVSYGASGAEFTGTYTGGGGGFGAWDIESFAYTTSFSVSGQDTAATGLAISADGTKLYMIGTTTDSVYQYDLSVAYDLSTASYSTNSLSVTAQDTSPSDLFFKPDGTKMYVVGTANDRIFQYTLSTPWDLSTASYDSVSALLGTNPASLYIKSDGAELFTSALSSDVHYKWTMSTPWDLSTLSLTTTNSDAAHGATGAIFLSSDGTKIYTTVTTYGYIWQYALGSAWDLTTLTANDSVLATAHHGAETNPQGLCFKPDGTELYVVGSGGDAILQYSGG